MSAQVQQLSQMKRRSTQPSRRLLAAATAERDEIAKRREALLSRRRLLHAQIDDLDAELAELAERIELIERLAGPAAAPGGARRDERVAPTDKIVLRGPAIRQTAARVLLADPRNLRVIHYREWFALLEENGYTVAGKDPVAVFLTQLSRSPVVQRGTQSGVYEVRLDAPDDLQRELASLQHELRSLTSASSSTTNLGDIRARRTSLARAINRVEQALHEAKSTLEPDEPDLAISR